jgi:hypothetical protein
MNNKRKLTKWTIILNVLIVVGAGHGIGVLGLIEIVWLLDIIDKGIIISLNVSYDDRLGIAAFISLIGQLTLISSWFIKKNNIKFIVKVLGVIFLWVGLFFLTYRFTTDTAATISLITGIPFLVASILLIVGEVKNFVIRKIKVTDNIKYRPKH